MVESSGKGESEHGTGISFFPPAPLPFPPPMQPFRILWTAVEKRIEYRENAAKGRLKDKGAGGGMKG